MDTQQMDKYTFSSSDTPDLTFEFAEINEHSWFLIGVKL